MSCGDAELPEHVSSDLESDCAVDVQSALASIDRAKVTRDSAEEETDAREYQNSVCSPGVKTGLEAASSGSCCVQSDTLNQEAVTCLCVDVIDDHFSDICLDTDAVQASSAILDGTKASADECSRISFYDGASNACSVNVGVLESNFGSDGFENSSSCTCAGTGSTEPGRLGSPSSSEETLCIATIQAALYKELSDKTSDETLTMKEEIGHLEMLDEDTSGPEGLNGMSAVLFKHPVYRNVVKEVSQMKEKLSILQAEVNRLESENQRLEADHSHEIYQVQIETLEKTLGQQQREIQQWTEKCRQQEELSSKKHSQMKQDLESKLENMVRQYEAANKDKEAMVVKYATSEREVIIQKKEREVLDRKLKELTREKDLLLGKIKSVTSEKARICQMFDTKSSDLLAAQKEVEKLKEELNSREIKIKWAQNKLRTEIDAHKETHQKLDKVIQKLHETREEAEQVRRDSQAMIRTWQESQENRAYTLDQQLKEQQAQLIMERHEREDKEEFHRQLQQEVENLRKKHQIIIDENNSLSVKVQSLEKERLEYERNLSCLKRTMDKQQQDIVDLQAQLAEMEAIKMQLQHEQEKLSASQIEVERLRQNNAELQQDMSACREREAELLDFTQKLTEKNVRLQSEFSATEAKAQQLESEQGPLQHCITELKGKIAALTAELEQEKKQRQEESQLLARHLAERTQRADRLSQQLEDLQGENQVLRRKQTTTVKELTRELNMCRKRLEMYESTSSNNSLGQGSRASSCTSLNVLDNHAASESGNRSTNSSLHPSVSNQVQMIEPDRQMLIERIVKLQRANARKTEKIEFLEEHVRQLVRELQKKTRIIQGYVIKEEPGALSSEIMDKNKAELAKHGGIMASVYGSRAVDDAMTLELSLEINRKLQAVLEDTLLKNITLKENMDTLGMEIAKLSKERNHGVES